MDNNNATTMTQSDFANLASFALDDWVSDVLLSFEISEIFCFLLSSPVPLLHLSLSSLNKRRFFAAVESHNSFRLFAFCTHVCKFKKEKTCSHTLREILKKNICSASGVSPFVKSFF
jgi:hypothetical protein